MLRPESAGGLSVSQPASAMAAAIAADARSERTKGRRFNVKLPRPNRLPQAFATQIVTRKESPSQGATADAD